jgi:hypothetical protein
MELLMDWFVEEVCLPNIASARRQGPTFHEPFDHPNNTTLCHHCWLHKVALAEKAVPTGRRPVVACDFSISLWLLRL